MFSMYIREQVVNVQSGVKGTWHSILSIFPLVSSKYCVVQYLLDAKGVYCYYSVILKELGGKKFVG